MNNTGLIAVLIKRKESESLLKNVSRSFKGSKSLLKDDLT